MEHIKSWKCSACGWAGHRRKPATYNGLTIHQKHCKLFQQEARELHHPHSEGAERHSHKCRRYQADDYEHHQMSPTPDLGLNVPAAPVCISIHYVDMYLSIDWN